jgi:hypothetical protein
MGSVWQLAGATGPARRQGPPPLNARALLSDAASVRRSRRGWCCPFGVVRHLSIFAGRPAGFFGGWVYQQQCAVGWIAAQHKSRIPCDSPSLL